MKKTFSLYVIVWGIAYVLFNFITFVVPADLTGIYKDEAPFWVGYLFITAAFIGQLVVGYLAFKKDDLNYTFYNLPLLSIGYTGLIITFIVGTISMFIVPWVGAILCFIVLAITAILILSAKGTADAVEKIDENIKVQTFFIRALTVDAESIAARAQCPEAKVECKKVYEAVRYSDPMSHEALASVEGQILIKFNAFSDAVMVNNPEAARVYADELVILLGDRNRKCKMLK